MRQHNFPLGACAAAVVTLALSACGGDSPSAPVAAPSLQVLSSKPELVSGGSTLVSLRTAAALTAADPVVVTLNGADVSALFKPDPANSGTRIALLTGLKDGANVLSASVGGPATQISLTNYPRTGPMISGPHQSPYICQTQSFTLPDGTKLGDSTDANCSAPTKIVYVYRTTSGGALKPMTSLTALPADVASTTTATGATVPFVVRVETGTMNRGIYQNAVLHDPTKDAAPSPTTPPAGWNKRLLAVHGSGCTGGWYIQGAALGVSLLTLDNLTRLGEGYGIFNNSLNHPTNSCNATLAAESALMGKENFIKTFGVPAFTVSTGGSGGAYTSLQLADAYPGLFDGVFISSTFPDALSISMAGLDSRLLSRYYLAANTGALTEGQMVAVSGHKNARAWYDLALQSGRTDPVPGRIDPLPPSTLPVLGGAPYQSAVWNPVVPTTLRYNPATNPTGARPTVFDVARNIYGVDKATGFALRPFDNVGVQYGLQALNAGTITMTQFLDLNEKVGGYDQNANYVAGRVTGDAGAIRRAHQSGMQLNGNGGLAAIPVFDTTGLYDEDNFYHYQWFHFAVRERMAQANGDTRNHVMWRGGVPILAAVGAGGTPEELAVGAAVATQGWKSFIDWVVAYKADASGATQRDKVIARKPASAVDGCFTKSTAPQFIAETQTWSSKADSQCNTIWPSYSAPRIEAGGPLAANKLKCDLKPVAAGDYKIAPLAGELARLQAVFPSGVCDWSKAGVGQTGVVPYASFGPSSANLVFDVTK
ncbi:MAG: hypothetical protein JWR74_1594 [Polaromonas sp.]|nr:hypothetical protein [Polaromonas sp.]